MFIDYNYKDWREHMQIRYKTKGEDLRQQYGYVVEVYDNGMDTNFETD